MREATFLKLNSEHISMNISKNASLNVFYDLLLLCIECMNNHIRVISCTLTWLKLILNLWSRMIAIEL